MPQTFHLPRIMSRDTKEEENVSSKGASYQEQVKSLLEARFIQEIMYPMWLSNVMMVPKSNGKWHMCVNYIDLNKAYPKDSYPLLGIDGLVHVASGLQFMSFMDAYLGYNQIPLHLNNKAKVVFITSMANYCNKVMPFGLKNAGKPTND